MGVPFPRRHVAHGQLVVLREVKFVMVQTCAMPQDVFHCLWRNDAIKHRGGWWVYAPRELVVYWTNFEIWP